MASATITVTPAGQSPRLALPAQSVRDTLLTSMETLMDHWAWQRNTSDQQYFSSKFEWNATQAGSASTWNEYKLGAAVLAAALWRLKYPHEERYRRMAIQEVDYYVATNINGSGLHSHTGDAAGNGTIFPFALVFMGMVSFLLGEDTRWATPILLSLDYANGQGEKTYYTNGNFNMLKAACYWVGARASGLNATRLADFETAMAFLYSPNTVAGGSNWRGVGYRQDVAADTFTQPLGQDEVGYFSEVTSTNISTDFTSSNVYDPLYTIAQNQYAGMGYLMSGDVRFARATNATLNKTIVKRLPSNYTTDLAGSRTPSNTFRNYYPCGAPVAVWMLGNTTVPRADVESMAFAEDRGMLDDYSNYWTTTHVNFYRGAAHDLACWLMAAHGLIA